MAGAGYPLVKAKGEGEEEGEEGGNVVSQQRDKSWENELKRPGEKKGSQAFQALSQEVRKSVLVGFKWNKSWDMETSDFYISLTRLGISRARHMLLAYRQLPARYEKRRRRKEKQALWEGERQDLMTVGPVRERRWG